MAITRDLTRVMSRLKAIYRSWAIPCAGQQVYAPCYRSEWLAKIREDGVRRRAELYYQQFDALAALRHEARREIKEARLLFHSFRRLRTVHLRKNRVPWDLEKFWIGHASKDITDRYTKSSTDDLTWRKQVARRTGLGFSIPVGQLVVEEISLEVCA